VVPAAVALDAFLFAPTLAGRTPITGPERLILVAYALVAVPLLLVRRRAPVPVFVGLLAHSLLARVLVPLSHPTACLLVGLGSVSERRPIRDSIPALLATLGTSAFTVREAVVTEADRSLRVGTLIAASGAYLVIDSAVWAFGWWLGRTERRLAEGDRRRAADLESERLRAEATLAAERGRIARELHDIVAHSVTVMVLQAAGARRLLERRPDLAAQALGTIEDVGVRTMEELRRLLGVLRQSGHVGPSSGDEPMAGLAQLDDLVQSVRANGIAIRVDVVGEPEPLDASVDLAAYRVVQEGLTNVAKHSGPGTTAIVALAWSPDRLVVTVRDDGAGSGGTRAHLSTGHGLLGLRERVGIAGGELHTRALEEGGYLVEAWLPLRLAREDGADVEPSPEPTSGRA
jgi:signal transduction histidine kinase